MVSLWSRGLALLSGILIFSFPSLAQTNLLPFHVVDADYSKSLDRLIMVSANPNQLHIYDATTQGDTVVSLAQTPLSLSVSPDGLHAAVGHINLISYVNLQTAAVEKTFPVFTNVPNTAYGNIALGANYVYALLSGTTISVQLSSGAIVFRGVAGAASFGRVYPSGNAIYGTQDGQVPDNLVEYGTASGPIDSRTDALYPGTYRICGKVWFSPDGKRVYNGCGTVNAASTDPSKDLQHLTSIPGVFRVIGLDESAALNEDALIPGQAPDVQPTAAQPAVKDNEVRLLDRQYLKQLARFSLSDFTISGKSYQAHGKWVFFNKDSTALYALSQADSTSGLINDFAVQTIELAQPLMCAATFSSSSATARAAGLSATVNIAATPDCQYQAATTDPWLQIVSGAAGSGAGTLTYLVRPNTTTSPRTGTITLGAQTLTITQDAALGARQSFQPLAYKIVAADYSASLQKLVFVSTAPDELHVYDPVTQTDNFTALSAAPLSLYLVGNTAFVGHDGWISTVNLVSPAVTQIQPVSLDANRIAVTSNMTVYAFSRFDSQPMAVLHAGLPEARVGSFAGGSAPLLPSQIPYRLYVNDGQIVSEWDLNQLYPTPFVPVPHANLPDCGNWWQSGDGARIFTACAKAYQVSSTPQSDLLYLGQFSMASQLRWITDSQAIKTTALIPDSVLPGSSGDTEVQFYSDSDFAFEGRTSVPAFSAGGATYPGHGRYVFWNADGSSLYIVEQADPAANLASDWAVSVITSGVADCHVSFATYGASLSANAASGQLQVTADPGCAWTASSNATDWLTIVDGAFGVGNGFVRYSLAANPSSSSRRGAITVWPGQMFNIQQVGAGTTAKFTPSSITLPAAGGQATVTSTVGSDVISDQPWLTVVRPGGSPGEVTISASPNLGQASRVATVSYNDQHLVVTQLGSATAPTGLVFVPVSPCRVVDTRTSAGLLGGPTPEANTSRDFPLPQGACGLPASAQAYSVNVTAIPQAGPLYFLSLWPSGQQQPLVSTLNSYDGRIVANAAIVPAGANGAISAYVTNKADVVIDVNGYFTAASAAGLDFYSVAPCRLVDTRNAASPLGGPFLSLNSSRDFPIQSAGCGLPAASQAYSLNVTAIPNGPLPFLTVWPTGQTRPAVSTLNAFEGTVVANAALTPAGTNGAVSVFAAGGQSDVVLDVNGAFAPPGDLNGLRFYPVTPCRAVDTRGSVSPFGAPSLEANSTRAFVLTTSGCNLPTSAQAFAVNITALPKGPKLDYLTAWAAGLPQPAVSTLNSFQGKIVSNAAIVPTIAPNGAIYLYVTDPTDVIIDVNGYFAP